MPTMIRPSCGFLLGIVIRIGTPMLVVGCSGGSNDMYPGQVVKSGTPISAFCDSLLGAIEAFHVRFSSIMGPELEEDHFASKIQMPAATDCWIEGRAGFRTFVCLFGAFEMPAEDRRLKAYMREIDNNIQACIVDRDSFYSVGADFRHYSRRIDVPYDADSPRVRFSYHQGAYGNPRVNLDTYHRESEERQVRIEVRR